MILDASAIIALVRKEADHLRLRAAVEQADVRRISAATYLETAIVIDGNRDPILSRELDDLCALIRAVVEPVTERQARIAREAYRDYGRGSGHPARLNFGDCFAYALARDKSEPLLYKGDDFSHTDIRSALA
ncbi:MAG: type II toxin-antitoxin system VapC family toxin [Bauldia sp.]